MAWRWFMEVPPVAPGINSAANCINMNVLIGGVSYTLLGAPDQAASLWTYFPESQIALAAPASQVIDVNDNGEAVGVWGEDNTPTQHAFLYSSGVLTDLAPLLPAGSQANGINNNGIVTGVCNLGLGAQGFVYDSATRSAPTFIDSLPSQNANPNCYPQAINKYGEVVGTSGSNGFFYYGDVLVDLGPAFFVNDINDSGIVVGSMNNSSGVQVPVYWNILRTHERKYVAEPPVELPLPVGYVGGIANAINNNGDVVGQMLGRRWRYRRIRIRRKYLSGGRLRPKPYVAWFHWHASGHGHFI
jgi:probable HAF family extracellular repeat protein